MLLITEQLDLDGLTLLAQGRIMALQVRRFIQPSHAQAPAHHDIFAKDAPEALAALSLQQQFAANIYLAMPEQGGELQLWQQELAADLFDQMRGDSYGIDPALLGEPTVELQPAAGDLVLFNSRKMHAVASSQQRSRLSLSCFVGYRGYHHPLTFWS